MAKLSLFLARSGFTWKLVKLKLQTHNCQEASRVYFRLEVYIIFFKLLRTIQYVSFVREIDF